MRDLDRDTKVGTLGVTQQVIDTQKALVAQQTAQLQADQAAIDSAQAAADAQLAADRSSIFGNIWLYVVVLALLLAGIAYGLYTTLRATPKGRQH